MLDAGLAEAVDDLLRLLGRGDARGDAESLDREAFLLHLLPQRELERPTHMHFVSLEFRSEYRDRDVPLALVDVERVERDADAGHLDRLLDLVDLGPERLLVVVSSTGELDVEAGLEDGRDEAGLDGARRHAGDHERRLAKQPTERRVNVHLAVIGPHQARAELLRPPHLAANGAAPRLVPCASAERAVADLL